MYFNCFQCFITVVWMSGMTSTSKPILTVFNFSWLGYKPKYVEFWFLLWADLNSFPLRDLEETTGTPPYYVDEDYPAGPEINEPLPERSNWRDSESSTLEIDVYIWRYALIVVLASNEWMNLRMLRVRRTEDWELTVSQFDIQNVVQMGFEVDALLPLHSE